MPFVTLRYDGVLLARRQAPQTKELPLVYLRLLIRHIHTPEDQLVRPQTGDAPCCSDNGPI